MIDLSMIVFANNLDYSIIQ